MADPSSPAERLIPVGVDLGSLHARVAVSETPSSSADGSGGAPSSSSDAAAAAAPSHLTADLPSVVSNAQGGRYTLALAAEEVLDALEEEDGKETKEENEKEEENRVTFIFGEAARRTLDRSKAPLGPRLVRHLSTASVAGSGVSSSGDDEDDAAEAQAETAEGRARDKEAARSRAGAASAAFLSHLADLACDATSSRPSSLRFVVSVPADASPDLVRGVVTATERGVEDAVVSSEKASGAGGKSKRKKKKETQEKGPIQRVVGVLSDPAAICVAHGLTDVDARGSANPLSLSVPPPEGSSATTTTTNPPSTYADVLTVDWGASGLTLTHLRPLGTSRVLSIVRTETNADLGGRHLIETVVSHCASAFERKNRLPSGEVLHSAKAKAKLTAAAETAVRTLGRAKTASVTVDGLYEGIDCDVPLSLPRFDMLTGKFVRTAGSMVDSFVEGLAGGGEEEEEGAQEASGSGGGRPRTFDVVLTAGNVSDMPSASNLIAKRFPDAWRGRTDVPADEAVALGCARHAATLLDPYNAKVLYADTADHYKSQPSVSAVPVSPVSVGVRLERRRNGSDDDAAEEEGGGDDGAVAIIGEGTPLPANVTRTIELGGGPTGSGGGKNGDERNDAITLAVVQMKGKEHGSHAKVLGRIANVPTTTSTVEITLELSRNGRLTMAVNGGESVSL